MRLSRRKRQIPRLLFTTRPVTNHQLSTTAPQPHHKFHGSFDLDAQRLIDSATVPCSPFQGRPPRGDQSPFDRQFGATTASTHQKMTLRGTTIISPVQLCMDRAVALASGTPARPLQSRNSYIAVRNGRVMQPQCCIFCSVNSPQATQAVLLRLK